MSIVRKAVITMAIDVTGFEFNAIRIWLGSGAKHIRIINYHMCAVKMLFNLGVKCVGYDYIQCYDLVIKLTWLQEDFVGL